MIYDYSGLHSAQSRIIEVPVAPEAGEYSKEESGIAVSVVTEDGTFDEPVVLSVAAIDAASDAYATAEEELAKIGHEYEGMVAFDIHFTSQATGAEVEPNKPVDVKIEITDAVAAGVPEEALGALTIAHVFDNGGAEIVSAPAETSDEEIALPGSAEFETGVFSTYTISWGNSSYNIHYVDTNGASLTPTRTPEFSNQYRYLIYDVEGYEYDSCHLDSITGTAISPYIENYNRDRIYQRISDSGWYYLRDDIYVVYKAKTAPTTGGTPKVDKDEWPEGSNAPQFSKDSVNNGNGTNTIALEIVAAEKPVDKSSPADVIVVFDVSGSMGYDMNGQTRLARAKTAVKTMANTLMGEGSDVRMALISFSNEASLVQGFTNNAGTFTSAVDNLGANGGTNWEDGLKLANTLQVRSDAGTFVVFVTDGDPTFRISRGNVSDSNLDIDTDYYLTYNVFGTGSGDSGSRNFNFAVDQVKAIAGAKKQFYAIGISNDVTKVQNLTTQGGVDASHAFIASNSTAMENAFNEITNSIKAVLGFGDVAITDGITELTNAEMKVIQSVDPNSFKYYRYGGENNKYGADKAHKTEWTTRAADGCAAATYKESDGAVHWDMGESFQLEDGVHYVVTFNVWASQDAYDLIAELNNGSKTYATLTEAEKAQIVENKAPTATEPGSYALKTNTDKVNATYSQTTKNGDKVSVSGEQDVNATYHAGSIEDMELESMKLTVKKVFEDDLTAGEDRDEKITLVLKRRASHQETEAEFAPFEVMVNGKMTSEITLSDANEWTASFYVAPGVEVSGKVLEHGYDFTIAEPNIDYHYGLIEEIINPMVVDGEDKYYGDGELIESEETVQEYVDRSLTAVNRVKSGIDIKKVVKDTDGNIINYSDQEFTIKGKLLDADGNPYTFNPSWDDRTDKSDTSYSSPTWDAHQNDSGAYHKYDKDGKRIIYKGHFASTDNIEFTLKAGEYVRFINVPDGSTFEFSEINLPSSYDETYGLTAVTQHKESPEGSFITDGDVQPTFVDGGKAELATGVVGNKQYSITFTNKMIEPEAFYVYHSSDKMIEKIGLSEKDTRLTAAKNDAGVITGFTFNIANETKANTLYGGYYKSYKGQKLTDAQIVAGTYTNGDSGSYTYFKDHPTKGYWMSDEDGAKAYTYAYVKDGNRNVWDSDYYTADGRKMNPEAGTVYYLKEVPNYYLLPYAQYTYGTGDKVIHNMWFISALDDLNYESGKVGFVVIQKNEFSTIVDTLTVKTSTGNASVTLSPKSLFGNKGGAGNGVQAGYLGYWDASGMIKANESVTLIPFWTTMDGVKVSSTTSRTINFNNGKVGTGGMRLADTVLGSTLADRP